MAALTTTDLNAMRGAISDLLPDTCYVLSKTSVPDGFGGVTDTWGTAATYACRADYVSGQEIAVGGKVTPFTGYVFSLPHNAVVSEVNRILHGSITYAVKSVSDDKSWKIVTRVYVETV